MPQSEFLPAIPIVLPPALPSASPVIGIVTSEAGDDLQNPFAGDFGMRRGGPPDPRCVSYVAASYVSWIRSAGARAAPVNHRWPHAEIRHVLSSVSGVLLPGGTGSENYTQKMKFIIQEIADINRRGHYLPLWGTCLGFELMVLWTANPEALSGAAGTHAGAESKQEQALDLIKEVPVIKRGLRVELTAQGRKHRMFDVAKFPAGPTLKQWLEAWNISYNDHNMSFPVANWERNANLSAAFDVLATSDGGTGTFVTLAAGKPGWLPFFGVQHHPEKSTDEWNPSLHIDHRLEAIQANVHFALFFVEEARRSPGRFDTQQEEFEAVSRFWSNDHFTAFNVDTGKTGYFDAIYCFSSAEAA